MSWKWRTILFLVGWLAAAILFTTGIAKADPYCGPGNNWDPRHNICGPQMPSPGGGFPYPLPQDRPGGPYGGNTR